MKFLGMAVKISLSLLEYESELAKYSDQLATSEAFSRTMELVDSNRLYSLHIDVMRPPFILDRSAFPTNLIRRIYQAFHDRIALEMHLMVRNSEFLFQEFNNFVDPKDRSNILMAIQREAYGSEHEIITALNTIRVMGYRNGIALDLPTPIGSLTGEMVEAADVIQIMSVPMGKGGQKYDERATEKIRYLASRFPRKVVKVDGGINDKTARHARKAGAEVLVVGSFITTSKSPLEALERLHRALTD